MVIITKDKYELSPISNGQDDSSVSELTVNSPEKVYLKKSSDENNLCTNDESLNLDKLFDENSCKNETPELEKNYMDNLSPKIIQSFKDNINKETQWKKSKEKKISFPLIS